MEIYNWGLYYVLVLIIVF